VTKAGVHDPVSKTPRSSLFRTRRVWFAAFAALLVVGAIAAAVWQSNRHPSLSALEQSLAAVEEGDLIIARRLLAELKSSPSGSHQATLVRGALLLKKGFYYPAIDELQKVQAEPKLKKPALLRLGEAWYHLGRHIEAQSALQQVLEEDPDSVAAHRWLAASYYDLGAIHDAMHHLKRTAELDSADPRPHRLLGLIYKDYERYDDAIPCYEESLRRKQDQTAASEIRQELAACQVKLRRYQDALATLAASPASAEVDVLRAECHYALGDMPQARQAVADALKQDANHLEGLLLQGTMFLDEGEAKRAVEVLEHAARIRPKDYTVHFKLSQAYSQAGDAEASKSEQAVAEKIRAIRQEFADLHQAAWDRPGDAEVRLRLAAIARELDRPDLADVWLRSAAALQPGAPPGP